VFHVQNLPVDQLNVVSKVVWILIHAGERLCGVLCEKYWDWSAWRVLTAKEIRIDWKLAEQYRNSIVASDVRF
jgi:hypothetical protein